MVQSKFHLLLSSCKTFAATSIAIAVLGSSGEHCCTTCNASAGLAKYYSVASPLLSKHQQCGECCMDPKDFNKYHLFEKNLTKAASNTPCADFGFTSYLETDTHGFGPVKMTLDMFKFPATALGAALSPPAGTFCGSLLGIIKENVTFYPDGASYDYFNDINIAKTHVACTGEKYSWDGATGAIDISAALADPSDCMAKSTAGAPKSVPTFSWDGSAVSSKNGYGTLKMKPC